MSPMLAKLGRRIDNMVARAVVWMADDSTKLQQLQVSLQADEVRIAERFQQYGVSSVPLSESEAVLLFPGGLRDHVLAIAVDDRRYRPKDLLPGEVILYAHEGDYVKLKNGRIIEVVSGEALDVTAPEVTFHSATAVRIESPLVEMTGNLTVDGNITSGGTVQGSAVRTAAGVQLGTHLHSGVTAGGANTGAPV